MHEAIIESTTAPPPVETGPNENAGMTRRVVHGSLWGFGGQGVTLVASLIATPFVIRLLGSEAYGVLALINILIGYLAFTDLGMGMASTRFGADAGGRSGARAEAAVVWTSLVIAAVPSLLGASVLILLAHPLSERVMHLPPYLIPQVVIALRLTAVGFVARTFAGVLNTPQLVRLRMDLVIYINTGTSVVQIGLVPIVLGFGGGLVGAVITIMCVNIVTLLLNALISWRLLPALARPTWDPTLFRPLLKFGSAVVVSSLVGMALVSAEKLCLTRFSSVTALAHYSIAYTLANVLLVLPSAMNQSLIPAFSRLQATKDRGALGALYIRAQRGTLIWLPPAVTFVLVGAKPFVTLWAGPNYADSVVPFYILVVGLAFNVMALVPFSMLMAIGSSDVVARYHLLELLPYLLGAAGLTYLYGPKGAAAAWSLRVIADALLLYRAARRQTGFVYVLTRERSWQFVLALIVLVLPSLIFSWLESPIAVKAAGIVVGIFAYVNLVWRKELSDEERRWVLTSWGGIRRRVSGQQL